MSVDAEVKAALRRLDSKIKSRAFRGSNILLNAEKKVLSSKGGTARTGRKYRKANTKARYTASAPGEPPARRTGNLRTSWKGEKGESTGSLENGRLSVDIKIKTDVKYDTYLEHGTSKMAARPHHDRIKELAMPEIEQLFSDL